MAVVLDEDEDVDDDVNVQVIVEDQSLPEESCLVMVKLDRINPYTFTFKAPGENPTLLSLQLPHSLRLLGNCP